MKILVVSQCFWPEEFRINDICAGLKEKGNEIEILTGLPNYPLGRFYKDYSFFKRGPKDYKGMRLHRTYVVERGKDSFIRLALNYLSFMLGALFHIPLLTFKKFDKVFVFQVSPITCAIPALFYKFLTRRPATIYIQDLWPETFFSIIDIKNDKARKVLKKICTLIYKGFDEVYIASQGYKDILVREGIKEYKIKYLPQWSEDIFIEAKDIIDNLSFTKSEGDIVLTFAGNIGKAQSVETIIEAANITKLNKNIKWLIIGDGSNYGNIDGLVKKYNLSDTVYLIGRKPLKDMPKYYSISDALIVTLKDTEILRITLPAKVQSYMASGKMLLGAISGEGKRVLDESKAGLVVEAEDVVGLAAAAIRIASMSEEERKGYGIRGYNYLNYNYKRDMLLEALNEYLINV